MQGQNRVKPAAKERERERELSRRIDCRHYRRRGEGRMTSYAVDVSSPPPINKPRFFSFSFSSLSADVDVMAKGGERR